MRHYPSLRDSCAIPNLPGTSVPGYHMPPLRGWILVVFVPTLLRET